jgi:hypothetical protein
VRQLARALLRAAELGKIFVLDLPICAIRSYSCRMLIRVLAICLLASSCGRTDENKHAVPLTLDMESRSRGSERAGDIVRLAPDALANLTDAIKTHLKRRGCTIPQFGSTGQNNVIRGSFTRPHQADTAVLCSVKGVSSILVFRADSASNVVELMPLPDDNFMQDMGHGKMEFSRLIAPADAKYIQEHAEKFEGPKPPPMDHEGINDIFAEKGSTVWYWDDGKWLELAGAS